MQPCDQKMESTCMEPPKGPEEPDLIVKIRELNPHIVCGLCAGYFIDATTITECSHTFCKSCIVKYFQTRQSCPQCGQKMHETYPLNNLRSDRVMQDVVYKLVPNLFKSEQEAEAKFYTSKGMDFTQSGSHLLKIGTPLKYTSQKVTRDVSDADIPTADVSSIPNYKTAHQFEHDLKIILLFEMDATFSQESTFFDASCTYRGVTFHPIVKNYVRCPSRATALHVKKLLRLQLFRHKPDIDVDVQICNSGVSLSDHVTMRQVFLCQSQCEGFSGSYVRLTYRFVIPELCPLADSISS